MFHEFIVMYTNMYFPLLHFSVSKLQWTTEHRNETRLDEIKKKWKVKSKKRRKKDSTRTENQIALNAKDIKMKEWKACAPVDNFQSSYPIHGVFSQSFVVRTVFVLKFIENLFIRFPELLFYNKRKWAHETKDNNLI